MGSLAVRMFTQGFIIPSRYAAVEANDMHQADGMQVHSWMAEPWAQAHYQSLCSCRNLGWWGIQAAYISADISAAAESLEGYQCGSGCVMLREDVRCILVNINTFGVPGEICAGCWWLPQRQKLLDLSLEPSLCELQLLPLCLLIIASAFLPFS